MCHPCPFLIHKHQWAFGVIRCGGDRDSRPAVVRAGSVDRHLISDKPMDNSILNYSRIWPRVGAFILDGFFISPLLILSIWGHRHYRLYNLYQEVPFQVFALFYHVYLVHRYGGEPGKLIFGMKIRQLDGSPVNYRQAFLRYLPTLLVGMILSAASTAPLLKMTDEEFRTLSTQSARERVHREAELAPPWVGPVKTGCNIWLASDAIVLLLNSKRRAIHDFIGQTVVVFEKAPAIAAQNSGQSLPTSI